MTSTCPQTAELERLIQERVPEPRASALTDHVESCPECQERMESLAAGGDRTLTKTVRLCGKSLPDSNSAMWPALSAVQAEIAATAAYPRQGEADKETPNDLDLRFLKPTSTENLIGRLGEFEIKRVVGRGGMGVVLHGFDPHLERDVAVKVLDPQLADNKVARMRFCREARAAAAVAHDNLVAIHSVDEDTEAKLPYLVMQLVAGESLEQRLKRVGKLSAEEVAKIGQQAAAGLAAAHAGGLIHRDIKPGNILLENGTDRVKVTDFGLARGVEDVRLTRTGFVAGTPLYMAPEQAHGENVDHRSDLFSLGSVLYEAATGRHPFEGKTPLAVLRRVADETQPSLLEIDPAFPVWLSDVIDRLLEKDPADRFQSASEVADILSLELSRHGIALPPGCGKSSAYSRKHRKPICWKSVSFRVLPLIAGILIGGLAVGLWPAGKSPEVQPAFHGGNGSNHAVDPGPEPRFTITGKAGPVWALAFSPKDPVLAVGAEDGTINLFNIAEKEPINVRTLTRNGRHVWNIDISRDGEYLVAPSDELGVEVYDLKTYNPVGVYGTGASTKSAVFTPDDRFLITGNRAGVIMAWERTEHVGVTLSGKNGTVHALAVSPDSSHLAASGSDGILRIFDLLNLKAEASTISLQSGPLYGLAYSPNPDMPRLASAGWDGAVRIWNPQRKEQLRVLKGHEGDVFGVAFNNTGKLVASSGSDGTVRLWDVESGKELQVFRGSGRPFHAVRFSHDGMLLAAGSRDGTVRVWDLK